MTQHYPSMHPEHAALVLLCPSQCGSTGAVLTGGVALAQGPATQESAEIAGWLGGGACGVQADVTLSCTQLQKMLLQCYCSSGRSQAHLFQLRHCPAVSSVSCLRVSARVVD